ncbi:MAG: MFS transporter [Bacteroidota bacterium]
MHISKKRADAIRLAVLGGVGFLTAFGAHIIVVNLPAYGREHRLGYGALGLLLAAYNTAEILAKPIAGKLADRGGPRPVMLWGTIFFTLSCLAYLWLPSAYLPGMRVCQGIGAGALSVASMAMVATGFRRRIGRAFGLYNALKGVGYVSAPLAAGLFTADDAMRGAFLAAGLAGAAVLLVQLGIGARLEAAPPHRGARVKPRGRLWPWYLTNFVDMAMLGILLGFLPVLADTLGYSPGGIGVLLTGATLAYLAAQPLSGAIADRSGRRRIVLAGLALGSVGLSSLGFMRGWSLHLAAILTGLGLGVTWTNSLARVGETAGEGGMGEGLGLAGSCKDAGDIAGPVFLGYLAGRLGIQAAFVISGLMGILVVGVVGQASKAEG